MRSAALFEADNERRTTGRTGRRPDTRRVSQARSANAPAREELSVEDPRTPGTEDGRNTGKSSWFLHDDRDREELDAVLVQRRGAVPDDDRNPRNRRTDERLAGVARDRASAGAPAQARPSRWEYVDPKGNIQGPFPVSDLLKWSNGGFFSADQKVRRAGQQAFVPLKSVLPQLNREAEGRAPPPAGTARRPSAAEVNGRGVREDAPVRRAVAHAVDGRQREQRLDRPGRGAGYQGQHPADSLLSAEESAARAHHAHGAVEGEGYAPREVRSGRGGRHGFEPAGRGGRRDDTGNQGSRERGRGGGRGDGYGRGGGRGQGAQQARAVAVGETTETRLPFSNKIAQKLFAAEAELATDEPMWRYIDPSGTVQGPFPARNMLEWYRKGMLHDMGLQVCGAERKVAPPDVPLPIHYYKLGDLLESVKRGQRFAAVTVADIRSGTARPLLFTKDAQASSGAKKADAAKAGKRKGSSAARPTKAATETVRLKLAPMESDDGVTVELTVRR
ncbi:hypothetical protein WJX75_008743 [Coccomyxa subellipsoidea]|uniref:GYF domain-containing protein n=1 Tax=Coccomyxa subellipsoidea TaxID=248742 RepID=A0ABR2YUQ1_9CHLO